MKRLITLGMMTVAVAMMLGVTAGAVTVMGVTARQIEPWGWVEIDVTMTGASNDVAAATCLVVAKNGTTKAALPIKHITNKGVTTGGRGNVDSHVPLERRCGCWHGED